LEVSSCPRLAESSWSPTWIAARAPLPKERQLDAMLTRLARHNETWVTRFVKVRGKASPFDPSLRGYWEDRRTRRLVREASHFHGVHLLQRQAGRCAACKAVFDPDLEGEHQHRGAPRHRRDDPCSRPPLVASRTVPRSISKGLADA
jgi:hypothetical protein